jgi:hypothetical protein
LFTLGDPLAHFIALQVGIIGIAAKGIVGYYSGFLVTGWLGHGL